MIIHGKQQILPPNMIIGRTQIQGACIGREVVFGSFWLSVSAQMAILGAFGQTDGKAVIKATNAYLNGIAAQGEAGKDKATALAGFINEDPMMVCSLGLEPQGVTMPIRWLVGDGAAIIDADFYPNQSTHAKCKANFHFGLDNPAVFGCRTNYINQNVEAYYIADTGSADIFNLGFGNQIVPATSTAQDPAFKGVHVFEVENKVFKLDGVAKATSTAASFTSTKTFCFPGYNDGYADRGYMPAALPIAFCEVDGVANMIPCKHNGQNGMYDIERMRWFGNANSSGSFTIPDISYTP